MHIPSRAEVLSWNENQVADLLREHKLLDCVDCIYQRHIDGQKLLYLKEGDVMYFLEIHDERSRGKFWNIIRRITEKKGGVQNLMSKFQATPEWNNNAVNQEPTSEFSDDSGDDSFESDYDEPEGGNESMEKQSAISLERQETIKRNLMGLISKPSPPVTSSMDDDDIHSSYPTSEEIYDVPEDGCGEPDEDMYDVPSDESGGGVVKRRPLERQESEQYLVPDDTKLRELSQTIDEEDYEDLGGAPPPMADDDSDMQEDYVVPDTKMTAVVPPRPPKSSSGFHDKPLTHKTPPVENGQKKPEKKISAVKKLQAKLLEQNRQKPPPQLPRTSHKKTEKKPPEIPDEQDDYEAPEPPKPTGKKPGLKPPAVEENYEPPVQPPRSKGKKPAVKPPAVEENYEPPVQPPPLTKRPMKKVPSEPEQDTYEPPDQPPRPSRKPTPVVQEQVQETYEPPEPQRNNKPMNATLDPEENYEVADMSGGTDGDADEGDQEDYEIPDTSEVKKAPSVEESPKKSLFSIKGFVNRNSKKNHPSVPPKVDKRNASKSESSLASAPTTSPAVPENRQPPSRQPPHPTGKNIFGKLRGEKVADKRSSMALPSLPTDNVDSNPKSQGSESPKLPPKPKRALETPTPKERPTPSPSPQRKPVPPTSRPPSKSKEQLLQGQPWFHGSVSKPAVSEMLKSAKKDGAYLVRNSSRDPGNFTMSILYKNEIRHLNMPCENGLYRLGESGTERFKNIEELVTYFNKHDVEFSAGGKTPLTHACMKK